MSVEWADVKHAPTDDYADYYSEPCDGFHDGERIDSWGRPYWIVVKCTCDVVPVGIVNGRARFAVRSTGSEMDDLPF